MRIILSTPTVSEQKLTQRIGGERIHDGGLFEVWSIKSFTRSQLFLTTARMRFTSYNTPFVRFACPSVTVNLYGCYSTNHERASTRVKDAKGKDCHLVTGSPSSTFLICLSYQALSWKNVCTLSMRYHAQESGPVAELDFRPGLKLNLGLVTLCIRMGGINVRLRCRPGCGGYRVMFL